MSTARTAAPYGRRRKETDPQGTTPVQVDRRARDLEQASQQIRKSSIDDLPCRCARAGDAEILVPPRDAAAARAHDVDPAVAVDIHADAAVHAGLVLESLIPPFSGRRVLGRVKHM